MADRVSMSAAIDIAALGFELPQVKGWKKAYELIREEEGGTLWVYDLIIDAGLAFSQVHKGVDWGNLDTAPGIWDDVLIEYAERVVKYINIERDIPNRKTLVGIAKAQREEAQKPRKARPKGRLPRPVKSLADLKRILTSGDPDVGSPYEFFIMLSGGLRSSKQMHYNDPKEGWYWVRNESDGTEQELDGDEALARETHIVEAIEKNAFIYTGRDE